MDCPESQGLEEVLCWGPPERVPGRRQWQCPVTGPGTQGSLDQLSWFARSSARFSPESLCPRKPLSLGETQMVGHPLLDLTTALLSPDPQTS